MMKIDKKSYNDHNAEYCESGKFEKEKNIHEERNKNDFEFIYQTDIPQGKILDTTEFDTAVDLGSGTGWFANYLVEHRNYKKVYAIEPSEAATKMKWSGSWVFVRRN